MSMQRIRERFNVPAKRGGRVKICTIEGCETKHSGRGYCARHYQSWRKYGDPFRAKANARSLDAAFGMYTKEEGDCLVWVGHRDGKGYGMVSHQNRSYRAHRVAWERANGEIPAGIQIDHTCHNHPCVKLAHLRTTTNKQNKENTKGPRKDNKTGILGVSWHKASQKYVAQVCHDGVNLYLGGFGTPEEAGEVAKAKRLELFTHNDLDREAA